MAEREGGARKKLAVSGFIESIEGSRTLAITSKVAELKAQGKDVIDLGAGQPDFPTPAAVREAGIAAIRDGHTRYTPNAGIVPLRQAIAEKLNALGGQYKAEQILVSCGAKHSIYNALLATCEPGDEVIVPAPYWTSYPEQVKLARAKPVIVQTSEANQFKITPAELRRAITAATKLLIFNSPSNPTGTVYTRAELAELAAEIVKHEIFVLSDEIYLPLVYDQIDTCSLAAFSELRERLILVNGLSKSHSMTGWRIGYLAARADVVKAAAKVQSHSTSNATSISQYAALAAVKSSNGELAKMIRAFTERRNFVVQELQRISGIETFVPHGAFYVFPNVSAYFGKKTRDYSIQNAMDLCTYLLEQVHVATVPGEAFGAEKNIRISYATSMQQLEAAMERIKSALEALH